MLAAVGLPASILFRLAVFGLLAPAALAVAMYRGAYGSWPWSGVPERLCRRGRTYLHESGTTDMPRTLHEVFRRPPVIGRDVYATVNPEHP
jgi:hypothetical protein